MSLFLPLARSDRQEILDQRAASAAEIAVNFVDIARVNRFLGGTAAVSAALTKLVRDVATQGERPRTLTLLDVATGSADIPRSLTRRFRKPVNGCQLHLDITATDVDPTILAHARRLTPAVDFPGISLEHADALALPYSDRAFDIATCSMSMHHFAPALARILIHEMARVTRVGFVINDLRRDRLAYFLIWMLTRLPGASPITRHDAPLSVLRAYTIPEIQDLARTAEPGMAAEVYAAPMFRAVLIARHQLEHVSEPQ